MCAYTPHPYNQKEKDFDCDGHVNCEVHFVPVPTKDHLSNYFNPSKSIRMHVRPINEVHVFISITTSRDLVHTADRRQRWEASDACNHSSMQSESKEKTAATPDV